MDRVVWWVKGVERVGWEWRRERRGVGVDGGREHSDDVAVCDVGLLRVMKEATS